MDEDSRDRMVVPSSFQLQVVDWTTIFIALVVAVIIGLLHGIRQTHTTPVTFTFVPPTFIVTTTYTVMAEEAFVQL